MRGIFAILLLLNLSQAFGQGEYSLNVVSADQSDGFFKKQFSYKVHFKDSLQAKQEAVSLLNKIRTLGYVAASIDSMHIDSLQVSAYLYIGERFQNAYIENGNADLSLLSGAGVKGYVTAGRPISVAQIEKMKANILSECENSGYPFASVQLDSFQLEQDGFSAKLFIEKNEQIRYDTLKILGKTKTKYVFLKNYLGIKIGKPYNESNIQRIHQRLRELQFVEAIQPHTVEFLNGKARINLFLKDKRSSQFDFLLGFLPGSSGQKLLITGDARLHLFSLFGVGEEFFFKWQKLQPKTQTLDIKFVYPYLIGLPLGINAVFQLYKKDTAFVDIAGDYGIQYQIIGSNYLKASLKQKTTIITYVDTAYIKANKRLPNNLDVSSNEFALQYFLQKLDYRFNPTSGYQLTVEGSAGARKIKKNNTVANLPDESSGRNFSYLYDTIKLKTFQFRIGLAIEKYWRLASRHTIKTSFDGKYLYAPTIFFNEKYRLGGMNSLRGFDDQSIFTPYYAMANLEYRFLLSKNSYFSTFFNAAMVEDARAGKGPFDFPFGFGAGGAIETKVGLFGITYAMGKQLDNKLSFKSGKIHFGYVNYF
ncbi:MAG: BamA/TamA family outer membrane protein [Bacteroidetes bacterium]|nr:BamA/TamA family outer membrane protein [Bacteroidota bacterium]